MSEYLQPPPEPIASSAAQTGLSAELPAAQDDAVYTPDATIIMYDNDTAAVRRRRRVLTAEEETALAQRIERGKDAAAVLRQEANAGTVAAADAGRRASLQRSVDEGRAAWQAFAEHNIPLVVAMAKTWAQRTGLPLDELIGQGNLQLLEAVAHFDWRRNAKFSSYFKLHMLKVVNDVAAQNRRICIPKEALRQINRFRHRYNELAKQLGRDPTMNEMIADMSLGNGQQASDLYHQAFDRPLSLDEPIGDDGTSIADFIEEPDSNFPERIVALDAVNAAMQMLSPLERAVVGARFGLRDGVCYSLSGTAEMLRAWGVVPARKMLTQRSVRHIEAIALEKLRCMAEGIPFNPYSIISSL